MVLHNFCLPKMQELSPQDAAHVSSKCSDCLPKMQELSPQDAAHVSSKCRCILGRRTSYEH
jgi:hypothetical protein